MTKKKYASAEEEELISITAPLEEWRTLERLVTSYRQQSRTMRRYSPMLTLLNSFQRRFTEQSGFKSPDDYMI
jgi:hypothetical protein